MAHQMRTPDVHERMNVSARRWGELPGFEQWSVQAQPGSTVSVYIDHFVVTSQAPGPPINCVARVRGQMLENRRDIVQIYNPGDHHTQLALREPESYHVAFLDPKLLTERAIALGYSPRKLAAFRPQVGTPEIVRAFRDLHAVLTREPDAFTRQVALSQAMQALIECGTELKASEVTAWRAPRAAARARAVLEDRYGEALTLDELAAAVGLNKEHLIRTFKKAYGVPPHQYLMHIRLTRARAALAAGVTCAQVAVTCGFFDQSHLNRHFRRAMGASPLTYARATRPSHGLGELPVPTLDRGAMGKGGRARGSADEACVGW